MRPSVAEGGLSFVGQPCLCFNISNFHIFLTASLIHLVNLLERFLPFGETMPQCCLVQGKGWHGLVAADVATIVVLLLRMREQI